MYGRISFLRNTKLVGDISEIKVAAALVEAGYRVFFPFGENHRYDLLAEDQSGSFHRIQVKTGRIRSGTVVFKCYSVHETRDGMRMQRYAGQIDYFGVYCPDNRECYLVPIEEVGSAGSLRIHPCENAQRKKIRWAEPYRIAGLGLDLVGARTASGVSFPGLLPS
ncbi:MAG: hypothetical protein JO322_15270 [Candidatus Eremiobacteraeota bacterium]|nr:hypothetical protein [Candidatus Eremiobacteraeota bacterium]